MVSRSRPSVADEGETNATARREADEPWGVRLALGSGALFGVVYLANLLATRPGMLGVNAHVYFLAGAAVRSGGDLYGVAAPEFANLPYVYPPIVALAFVPYAGLGSWPLAFAVHTVGTLAGCLVLARLLVELAERGGRSLPRIDRVLVALFVLGSVHVVPSLYYGNVNPLLVLSLAAGVVWADRSASRAGVAFAVPAVVKAFPAVFGLWLLRRRNWRAVGAAVATGLLAVAGSLLLFGVRANRRYLTAALLPRRRTEAFAGGLPADAPYLTIRRPLSVLVPDAEPVVLALLAGLALAPISAYLLAADVDEGPGALVALHGAVAGTLLFFPSYQTYYVFLFVTLVPLLYRLPRGRARTMFVAGVILANVSVTLPGLRLALGPPIEAPVVAALGPVLTLGTPRLYGTLLTLAACACYRLDHE